MREDGPQPGGFWAVVQHFTVAELRTSLGIDAQPVGLGTGIANAFPGIKVTYEQQRRWSPAAPDVLL
jgi:hypothetical protein